MFICFQMDICCLILWSIYLLLNFFFKFTRKCRLRVPVWLMKMKMWWIVWFVDNGKVSYWGRLCMRTLFFKKNAGMLLCLFVSSLVSLCMSLHICREFFKNQKNFCCWKRIKMNCARNYYSVWKQFGLVK